LFVYFKDESIETICKRTSCLSQIRTTEESLFGDIKTGIADGEVENWTNITSASVGPAAGEDEASVTMALQMAFVNEWLGFVADAIIGLVLVQVSTISKFSSSGAAQLAVDVEYVRCVKKN